MRLAGKTAGEQHIPANSHPNHVSPKKSAPLQTAAIKRRRTSILVATKPGCEPLKLAYEAAVAKAPKSWNDIEDLFLRGMEGFDANVASGLADMGDLQNGKGDFFNDLLALILENCAGIELWSRGSVRGLIIPKHNLDVTYPETDPIEFILEAKAVGTPKHPGSPAQRAIGRPGSADLDKRIKEIGFKTIDLKAEYSRQLTAEGQSPTAISGDLTRWLRSVKPHSFCFIAARVTGDGDREQVVRMAHRAGLVSDAVGIFCFRPVSPDKPTTYRADPVPSDLELARVMYSACVQLTTIRNSRQNAAR